MLSFARLVFRYAGKKNQRVLVPKFKLPISELSQITFAFRGE